MGHFLGEALDEQVLLIKVAAGGASLYQHWRPPSAGLPKRAAPEKFSGMYRALVQYVHQTAAISGACGVFVREAIREPTSRASTRRRESN
ncbi:MAG: hypothetical protein N2C14_25720 [Planctomycetales bacterium]